MANIQNNSLLEDPEKLRDEILKPFKTGEHDFPVESLPVLIQKIIMATNEALNFPVDYIATSILYAVSVAIGNTHKVEVKTGWTESPTIYLAIVGEPGTLKSHPLHFAVKPIEKRDTEHFKAFKVEKSEYDQLMKLTAKEREEIGEEPDPKPPELKQHLVSDFTPEALAAIHDINRRGLGVYVDELASWIGNFNRYNKGAEEQFWLSVYSGKAIRVNRKSSDPVLINAPFVSVAGTIQPQVLTELSKGKSNNGFSDRILFCSPKNQQRKAWTNKQLNPDILDDWEQIINRMILQDYDPETARESLQFTDEARNLLYEWQADFTAESNKPLNTSLKGVYAKLEVYTIRFSLIIEALVAACDKREPTSVSFDAVEAAIQITDYFLKQACKIQTTLRGDDPLNGMAQDKLITYQTLPEVFKTAKAVEVAKEQGMKERQTKHWLNDKKLFQKIKHGTYEKQI